MMQLVMEKADVRGEDNCKMELCKGEISGARTIYYQLKAGSVERFTAGKGYYRIFILVKGKVAFVMGCREYPHADRAIFVPAVDQELELMMETDVWLLEIQWDINEQDQRIIMEYRTEFPISVCYEDSVQYKEAVKSEKTINRMMIPPRVIPRLSIGSVETTGYDIVQAHMHPAIDQLFFSFPENEMDVWINGIPVSMEGNVLMHIPLGSEHGVEVQEAKHMHYVWIDFMPDNESALAYLDASHQMTEEKRSLEKELI